MEILFAAATLGGVGLIFGALLALAARVFAVETEPRVDAVREALPGVNCGACGYPGCTGFAEAVVQGEAEPGGCTPGGAETARIVAEIIGVERVETTPLVATVFCIGDTARARDLFVYEGIQDCAVAEKYYGGFKACSYGCLGLGSCVRACPFDAIYMGAHGLPVVNWERCSGCGLCAKACPREIIQILPKEKTGHLVLCNSHDKGKKVNQACSVGCNACTACVRACPQEAIAMQDNLAVIDLEKCNDCGECVLKCRPGTIHPRSRLSAPADRKKEEALAANA